MRKLIIIISILFITKQILAKDFNNILNEIDTYFNSLNQFSATFIQENESSLEEGVLYKNKKRIRIDYFSPSKITVIFSKNKAMFFNQELEEVEYFNPKKTMANIIIGIFNNKFVETFENYKLEENFISFNYGLYNNDIYYLVEVIFEISPIQLRMVNITSDEEVFSFGLRDHNFNNSFEKEFFSMANPLLN